MCIYHSEILTHNSDDGDECNLVFYTHRHSRAPFFWLEDKHGHTKRTIRGTYHRHQLKAGEGQSVTRGPRPWQTTCLHSLTQFNNCNLRRADPAISFSDIKADVFRAGWDSDWKRRQADIWWWAETLSQQADNALWTYNCITDNVMSRVLCIKALTRQ